MDARTEAFLREMGIAPLWHVRPSADAPEAPPSDAHAASAARGEGSSAPEARSAATHSPLNNVIPAHAGTHTEPVGHTAPLATAPAQPSPSARAPAAPPSSGDSAWDDDVDHAPAARAPTAPQPDATPDQIARMDWEELRAAIASCQRCGACRPGTKPVLGSGAQQARWLVTAGATTSGDEKDRTPVSGDAGKLLTNMLSAAGLSRTQDVYVTNLIKCRPSTSAGADRAPTAEEAQACRPFLEREIALTGAGTVLTLGQIAANALLERPLQEPLASARGTVHSMAAGAGSVPLVATLHPGELLRRGQDKALAWADLCLAKAADAGHG